MDGFATLGPLHYRSSLLSRPEEKQKDVKHLSPRLARTHSIPHERCLATRAGHTYEEHHRRELLAFGIFLTAAAQAQDALAGQSNGQLADEYYERTDTMVKQIKDILSTDITSLDNQEKLEEFKRDASAYVADYRRIVSPAQKSFSEVYGVVTAMVGHFTAYGLGKKNFSSKLKDKNSQRIAMAEKLLERERAKEAAKANVA